MAELAWEVARHLPYLRRYARAILGDRERGDATVRACLESLLPRAAELGVDDVKLQLYRALHHLWTQDGTTVPEQEPVPVLMENQTIVAARVGHLSPTKRQILVLTVLEGFSLPEAAAVMGLSLAAAEALLGQAKEELRSQRASRVLIIEDEPVIALDIAATVRQSGHTVVGIASTHRDAVAVADRETPELILADIQLADDSSGLDAVQEILQDRYVPVVFITAFPERLLTGTRPEPTFLITKPFDADTLRVSISQALSAGGAIVGHVAPQ
jgi:CheY-like chemotaxis protein/DNA-directed RNA polymerase specialized sigma24 family protein